MMVRIVSRDELLKDVADPDKMVGLMCPNAVGEPGELGIPEEIGGKEYDKRIE